ncbi:hypothetical protein LUX57_44665 [Actinomadura madurae]|uniref:hypothetical protein n=1 Tax=Actinomadura madurae TaxID=1993 RepID=UPI0020D26114|nr:hypothetical protein [Actinomadura madurae]MCP9971343.1 hypothetical protein [Actinomadura madurae]
MRNEGVAGRDRVPARVVVRGEPDGWHCVVVDGAGAEQRSDVAGAGTRWSAGGRGDPEPAWWRRPGSPRRPRACGRPSPSG